MQYSTTKCLACFYDVQQGTSLKIHHETCLNRISLDIVDYCHVQTHSKTINKN